MNLFKHLRYKAYCELRKKKGQVHIRKIKEGLGDVELLGIKSYSGYDRSLSVKQYLLNFVGGKKLINAILLSYALGTKIYFLPIPRPYQEYLQKNGIKVSKFFCNLTFLFYLVIFWCYGLLYFFKSILTSIIFAEQKSGKKYIYFDRISHDNLPLKASNVTSYDIISWVIDHFGISDKFIYHPVKKSMQTKYRGNTLKFQKKPFIIDVFSSNCVKVIIKASKKILSALVSFKWDQYLLLKEDLDDIFYNYGSKSNTNLIKYFIPNHVTIYRPLWTYKAEKNGVDIITYFYSISSTPLSADKKQYDYENISLMNWPKNLIFDPIQKEEYDKLMANKVKNQLVPPIYFNTSSKSINENHQNIIAVFDIDPQRRSSHFGISSYNDYDFDLYKVHKNFLMDIINADKNNECTFMIKPKRKLPKKRSVIKYTELLDELNKYDNVIVLPPEIPTFHLIEKAKLIISFPFTSTSVIAKLMSKRSIFYDSTNQLNLNDPGAHGIEIINNNTIQKWLKTNLK
tara:strand:+ start:279 stop:1817 length:1539 start_codon:yes stop_codon:yes gene_type:complete